MHKLLKYFYALLLFGFAKTYGQTTYTITDTNPSPGNPNGAFAILQQAKLDANSGLNVTVYMNASGLCDLGVISSGISMYLVSGSITIDKAPGASVPQGFTISGSSNSVVALSFSGNQNVDISLKNITIENFLAAVIFSGGRNILCDNLTLTWNTSTDGDNALEFFNSYAYSNYMSQNVEIKNCNFNYGNYNGAYGSNNVGYGYGNAVLRTNDSYTNLNVNSPFLIHDNQVTSNFIPSLTVLSGVDNDKIDLQIYNNTGFNFKVGNENYSNLSSGNYTNFNNLFSVNIHNNSFYENNDLLSPIYNWVVDNNSFSFKSNAGYYLNIDGTKVAANSGGSSVDGFGIINSLNLSNCQSILENNNNTFAPLTNSNQFFGYIKPSTRLADYTYGCNELEIYGINLPGSIYISPVNPDPNNYNGAGGFVRKCQIISNVGVDKPIIRPTQPGPIFNSVQLSGSNLNFNFKFDPSYPYEYESIYYIDVYKTNSNGDILDYIASSSIDGYSNGPNALTSILTSVVIPGSISLNIGDRIAITISGIADANDQVSLGTSQASYYTISPPPDCCIGHNLSLTYTDGVNCVTFGPPRLESCMERAVATTISTNSNFIDEGDIVTTCTGETMDLAVYVPTNTLIPTLYTAMSTCVCSTGLQYAWDFGDGYTTNGATASHNYANGGTYTLTVIASSTTGTCTPETFTATVNVLSDCCSQMGSSSITFFSSNQKLGPYCIGDGLNFGFSTNESCIFDPNNISYQWTISDGYTSSQPNFSHIFTAAGTYTVTVSIIGAECGSPSPSKNLVSPTGFTYTTTVQIINCVGFTPCADCIGSFAPPAGDYIVSVWVREDQSSYTDSYSSGLTVTCLDGSNNSIGTFAFTGSTAPVNKLIDGWQKIEQKFTIPAGTATFQLSLDNNSTPTADAYFDDIRIHPFNSSFKSYVYDPITLRLMAELDENNYATFYEYDEDGALIRVKKETAKGIMTIKEARNNVQK